MKLLYFEKIIDHVMIKWLFFVQRRDKGGAKAGLCVMLKYFRHYIKQIDSMLPCVRFSNRSQKTSKCGKNISDTLGYASCATFLFLPLFDVICDLLLNRRTATWNLFVLYLFYFEAWLLSLPPLPSWQVNMADRCERIFHLFWRHHCKSRIFERMENFPNDCCCPWTRKLFKNSYSR